MQTRNMYSTECGVHMAKQQGTKAEHDVHTATG